MDIVNRWRFIGMLENKKKVLIVVIIVGVLVGAGILAMVVRKNGVEAGGFDEEASSNEDVSEEGGYIALENYELEFKEMSKLKAEELREKIVLYFSYARPDLKTLSVEKVEKESFKGADDEESLGSLDSEETKFILCANNGEKFRVRVSTTKYGYELEIYNARGYEIYSYSSDLITKEEYAETDDLIEAIAIELPYEARLESGTEFTVFYDGEDNKLKIAGSDDENEALGEAACREAIEKAVSWARGLDGLNYTGEIGSENFVCE